MAATCEIDEQNGSAPGSPTANVSHVNYGSVDQANLSVSGNEIVAGENSFEKWNKMSFTGTFNTVDNLKIWKNSGAYVTGESIDTNARESSYGGAETYTTPTQTTSIVATQPMPETEPSGPNLGIGGSLSGQLTGAGDSDYLVTQLQTTVSTPAGDVNQKQFTYQWDET
jgi:hypothetical protein